MKLRAPFPWFGGKSRAAPLIWSRFGNVPNYVEPFAGSLAVLLARPHEPGTETVNDLDCYLANFWRAVRAEPEQVARWADWPVNEADLLARHRWLLGRDEFRDRMRSDPEYYDAKIAGWWLWGICSWIGSGWCRVESQQLPHLGTAGRGVHRQTRPHLGYGLGVNRRLPPHLGQGRGANRRKMPHLGDPGRWEYILGYMEALAARLRDVRVACGDWSRVVGEAVTVHHGTTAVLLDPPYTSDLHGVKYSASERDVAAEVREWAIANGENPLLRIALCGYDGEHDMPDGWTKVRWKANGGYANRSQGRGRENASRETIWFSPYCLDAEELSLFGEEAA